MLRRLPGWTELAAQLAARLEVRLAAIPRCSSFIPAHVEHAYYRYCFVRPQMLKAGWSRDQIVQAIVAEEFLRQRRVPGNLSRGPPMASPARKSSPVARERAKRASPSIHPTSRARIDDTAARRPSPSRRHGDSAAPGGDP